MPLAARVPAWFPHLPPPGALNDLQWNKLLEVFQAATAQFSLPREQLAELQSEQVGARPVCAEFSRARTNPPCLLIEV